MGPRTTLVGALFAIEVGILGAIIYFLGGTGVSASGLSANAAHFGSDREVSSLNAGDAPHIVVRDPDSRVVINVSRDGKVHVIDHTQCRGVFFGGRPELTPLHVIPTGSTILIERAKQPDTFAMFGNSVRRVEVQVPAAAIIDIQQASGADIFDVQAGVKARSQDGHIDVTRTSGDIDVESNDGHIDLRNVHATHITATTRDGHITAENLTVDGRGASATLHTESGHIRLFGSFDADGKYVVESGDGGIEAGVPESLALTAATSDGSIRLNGQRVGDAGGTARYHSAGASSGTLDLTTQSGRITINTSGAK